MTRGQSSSKDLGNPIKQPLINKQNKQKMNNLQFDFKVDKSTKTVFIDRAFNAELPLVWDAFTKQEILDQWWAPKPYLSKTVRLYGNIK